jgi:hypothetical protein
MNCRACWVALALLWFEQTENAMLFVVIMGSVWSMVIATDNGVRHVPLFICEQPEPWVLNGVVAVIVVIGLLADKILFSPWERFLHHRWGTAKS